MPEREMTKRVSEALLNPHVSCLSHPKGRYINRRPENALDLDRVFEIASGRGVAVEVNGLPDRLDLRGEYVRQAIAAGVRIVCSTDAHSVRGLGNMQLAVATARRAFTLERARIEPEFAALRKDVRLQRLLNATQNDQ